MTRTVKSIEPGPWSSALDISPVGIVGPGPQAYAVAEILRSHGCEAIMYDEVDDLVLEGEDVTLVVAVERSLVEAARDVKRLGPSDERPPVIVVCEAIMPGEVRLALSAGAAGVVLASSLALSLARCVAAVMAGQVCVPKAEASQVDPASLSPREKQILGLVVLGCMNSEIADRLFVAESTVKSHLSSAFTKLGVRSRNEAVDLILDSERGLGMGILGLGGEPIEDVGSASE